MGRLVNERAKALAFLALGGLLPIALVAGTVCLYSEARLRDNLALQLAISAEEVRDRVDREMYDRYRDLKSLADDGGTAADPEGTLAAFTRNVERKYPNLDRKRFLCLAVVRPGGAALYELGACETLGGRVRLDGPTAYVSKPRALKDGAPVLDTYFPLATPGPEAAGIRATEDLRPLSDFLAKLKLPGGLAKDVVLYSPENQVLARKNGDPGASLAEAFPLLDRAGAPPAYSARGKMAGGRAAFAAINTLAGAAPPLEALKWRVAVVEPLDDLSEPNLDLAARLRRATGIAALIASAVSAGACLTLLGVKATDAADSGA